MEAGGGVRREAEDGLEGVDIVAVDLGDVRIRDDDEGEIA